MTEYHEMDLIGAWWHATERLNWWQSQTNANEQAAAWQDERIRLWSRMSKDQHDAISKQMTA